MRRNIILMALIFLLGLGLMIARARQESGKSGNPGNRNQDPVAKETVKPTLEPLPEMPKKGTAAPDFTLPDLKGKTIQLSSLKGKVVVVNFWATWCEPCKVEMPWLVDLQKQYGPQGLQILGVAMDDADETAIREFSTKMGVNYPVLKGTEAIADLYGGLEGLPATFFVDRSGKIADEVVGLMSKSIIESAIKHALENQASAPAAGE